MFESMSERQNLQEWLTLYFLPGIGCTLINRLLSEFQTPAGVLQASPEKLANIDGLGLKLANRLADKTNQLKASESARREFEKISQQGISVLVRSDKRFPPSLKNIPDSPFLLYCRGNIDCLNSSAIAIVGSRSATNYGRRISFSLASELARHQFCVVSGMALGIDSQAHAGALAGKGPTIGVLGCGVDVIYPRQNRSLFEEVGEKGLLISEYPLGAEPEAFHFPERNRIISGLSQGVVVVEAALKSGSLITARLALDQGREVFAVPGRVDSVKSQGTHRLLQQGAKLVHNINDILEELHLSYMMRPVGSWEKSDVDCAGMSDEEQHLFACIETYPVNIDELIQLSGYDSASLADLLVRLELKGVVRQLPGQQYERCT